MSNFVVNPSMVTTPEPTEFWTMGQGSYETLENCDGISTNKFVSNDDVIGETVTKITISLRKVGTVTNKLVTAYIWDSGSNPNSPDATSTNTVNTNTMPGDASFNDYEFLFSGREIEANSHIGFNLPIAFDFSNRVDYGTNLPKVDTDGTTNDVKNPSADSWNNRTMVVAMGVYG